MRRYRSQGSRRVGLILDALDRSGVRIISPPRPGSAPYEITVETPDGERLELVCYAFTANKYHQRGRPVDEHRFQVKYGSDFHEYHELYFDPEGRRITLFLGVGIDEDQGIFVACDPTMHSPTWFSRSVEFKTHHIEQARELGWMGWERDRSNVRRKDERPQESYEVEAVLAFTPEHFLRYIQLERLTTGVAPGERLLIAERLKELGPAGSVGEALVIADRSAPVAESRLITLEQIRRDLEQELGYSGDDILRLIHGSGFRQRVALRGAAAEAHLADLLGQVPSITSYEKIDEDSQPDFSVEYKRRPPVRIECKNVRKEVPKSGVPWVDFQRTRGSKDRPCSRYYRPDEFEILAACLHPVTARWEYRFRATSTMDRGPRPECPNHLYHRPAVEGPNWAEELDQLLDEITT